LLREEEGLAARVQLAVGAVVAAVGFPLGLLAGWLIWG
jgi:hypothetical protein